jgi:dihydroorotate dehydrogenase
VTERPPHRPDDDDQPWDLDAEAWSELLSGPGRSVPVGGPAPEPPDLTTTYLGLELRSPLVASSSPLTGDVDALRTMDAAGVGAVVLPSLFEEQVEHELGQLEGLGREEHGLNPEAATGYRPRLDGYNTGTVRYLDLLRRARAAVAVPVIASLNGATPGGWLRFSVALADAGADAIELNVMQVVADAAQSGREVESDTLSVVESVARTCDLPIAVKLSPAWSALPSFARRLVDAGAAGLVLFGRAPHLEVDATTLAVRPVFGLSRPGGTGRPPAVDGHPARPGRRLPRGERRRPERTGRGGAAARGRGRGDGHLRPARTGCRAPRAARHGPRRLDPGTRLPGRRGRPRPAQPGTGA